MYENVYRKKKKKGGGSCYRADIAPVLPFTYLLIHSMEQSPSFEANRFAACQEIPRGIWNPNVFYRVYKCQSPVPILSQIEPIHAPIPPPEDPS